MEEFELPEDLTTLSNEELQTLLNEAVQLFNVLASQDTVTAEHMENLRTLRSAVKDIRTERDDRRAAAEATAKEIADLASDVNDGIDEPGDGEDGPEDGDEDGNDADGDENKEGELSAEEIQALASDPAPPAQKGEDAKPDKVAASLAPARRRMKIDLSGIKQHQTKIILPEEKAPGPVITAAAAIPGHSPGSVIDLAEVSQAIHIRAKSLKSSGGGRHNAAYYQLPFEEKLQVHSATSIPEGSAATMYAADQSRLAPKNGVTSLVASGGWCAPSETVYTLTNNSCPDGLWSAPEIRLTRGGLNYYPTIPLDNATLDELTWEHSEAADIAGMEKPCYHIPCPDPILTRCTAIGVCLEAGILTEQFFPELIDDYREKAMIAHEIRKARWVLQQALNSDFTTQVIAPPTFGALSAVYAQVALQVVDMQERYNLCENISLELVFPYWARNLFLADLARQNGVNIDDVRESTITGIFARLGVFVQFVRGIAPRVPNQIGGPNAAVEWPGAVPFFLYPAGSIQIGRSAQIELGVIYDSVKLATNDHTALFTEECLAVITRGPEYRYVVVPVCPDGATGDQVAMECGGDVSPGPLESPAES
ncbi:MAG TPA: major capsid protein [Gammaproteobacteria bacterium]|nr:major capsid protein [Gammaproteobacteria bacterium]